MTPKSEALIQQGKTNQGAALRLEENSTFSTVFAGSRDNRNLTESCRILLLHLTDVKPSNGRFTRYGTRLRVHAKGSYPYLLRTGSVRVKLRNRAQGRIRLFALDSSGKRGDPVCRTEWTHLVCAPQRPRRIRAACIRTDSGIEFLL